MRLTYVCSALLLLAACGNDETFIDAAVGDDTPNIDADTGIDAAPAGTVHVTTFARGGALPDARFAGAEVLVYGLDGTLRDRDQTDSNGEATLDVTSGDTVTAIYDLVADSDVYLTTFVGVKPGDDLKFGDQQYPATTGATVGTMTITWPALTGATAATLSTNCSGYNVGTGATSQVVTMYDYCVHDPFTAVLVSTDGLGHILEWGDAHDAAFVDGTTAAITTLAGPTVFSVNLTGISPEVDSSYEVDLDTVYDDAATYFEYPYYVYDTPSSGAVTGAINTVAGGDGVRARTYLYRNGNYGNQRSVQRLARGTATLTTPEAPLPWLSDSVLAVVPAHLIQWFEFGTTPYDYGVVEFDWSVDTAPAVSGAHLGSGSSTYFEWDIVYPPGLTSLAFPALPSDLEAYGPSDSASFTPYVSIYETDAVDGYDAARALPEWTLRDPEGALGAATYPHVHTSEAGGGGGKSVRPGRRSGRAAGLRAPRTVHSR